jgi:ABC-type Fe3+-siderophore transport system permease subunit
MQTNLAVVHDLAIGVGSGTWLGGIIGGIIFAAICYFIADRKGRNPVLWAVLGFFFSLITLIVVLILPRKR